MKEMLGGCCVCSDERGWTENPLVYCDGQGCTVAVHQACYGIVTVPTGPWYCRKCESQERSARVRCELCPSRDGALKRTDQAGWAHVVCALYIPEVRFGNVTTMEPIILQLIPSERFSKSCYICEEQGRGSRANVGACMQCNKTGCRQQFHVTCAQALGLLCEEAGNYLDNVKYCGYCQHHYSKLKKGGNVKTIPPYKPIPADNGSSDSSPEKEAETPIKSSSSETIVTQSESVFGHDGTTSTTAVAATTIKSGSNSNSGHKNSGQTKSNSSSSNKTSSHSKKRKTGARTPTVIGNENSNQSVSSEASGSVVVAVSSIVQQAVSSNNIQTTITEATSLSTTTEPEKSKKLKVESPIQSSNTPVTTEATTTPVIMTVTQSQSSTVAQSPTTTSNSIVVSVPLTATSLSNTVQSVVTSAPTLYQQLQQSIITTAASMEARANAAASNSERFLPDDAPAKRSRSQSSDKQEKSRKPKRGSSNSQPALPQTQLQTQPQQQQQQQSQPSASSVVTSVSSSAVVTTSKRSGRSNHQTPPPAITVAPVPSIIQGPTLGTGHFSSINSGSANAMGPTVKESPPSSPGSESMSSNGPGRRKRKSASAASTTPTPSASSTPTLTNPKEEKDIKLFQNGVSAPHMLGNQLNPTSTMAQKMSDTLSQELEAHSIFTEASNSTTNLVGPQLHSRVIASIRSNQTGAPPTSFSSVFNTNSNTNSNLNANSNTSTNITATGSLGGGTIPQTLDQLLERQWEQGSQFLMEQAQHFDSEFASLLSCLHQLRAENLRLEEHVNSLLQRRDHLLAVNARLAIPLTTQPSAHPVNNIHPTVNPSHPNVPHPEVPPGAAAPVPRVNREPRVNNTYMPHSSASNHSTTLENGLPPDPSPPAAASLSQYQHRTSLVAPQPSPTIRHSPAGSAYHQGQPSNIVSPAPAGNSGVVRNSSVTPDPVRGIPRSVPQSSSNYMPSMYQPTVSSLASNQVGNVHNLHSHGPSPPSHGPPGKPS
ncbi:coiled coil domain containing protein Alhambra isoform X4 [Megachile rotundata]|uniref:coiled coil domain containing protein Alhambra isoform X4 n=1 Tax=Megachile rotundata TaxID=143995 RepID=UPI0006152082|nr:PREDICTED: protein AF-10 isoform X4 [Megachile rotundata]